jgi:sigma-B regulation protein RsbU (phosphoserine phosphatase)
LLQSVAAQTGLALENNQLIAAIASEVSQRERLNREVEIAREVQERLFPQNLAPVAGLDYNGSCRPALGVGGDYYDFLSLPDNQFCSSIRPRQKTVTQRSSTRSTNRQHGSLLMLMRVTTRR